MSEHESYACKRLSEQIKFFGVKPKRFVSIYAKKPRIRLSAGSKAINQSTSELLKMKHKLLSDNTGVSEIESQRLMELYLRNGLNGLTGYAASEARQQQEMARQATMRKSNALQRGFLIGQLSNMTGMASALGQVQAQGLGRNPIYGMGASLPQSIFW